LQTIAAALGPEAIVRYVNPTELITRFAASDGIDTKGLVKTEQQLADEQAIAQKVQLEQQLAQSAISGQGQPGGNGAGAPVAPAPAAGPGAQA
jgi:hypothetical protein